MLGDIRKNKLENKYQKKKRLRTSALGKIEKKNAKAKWRSNSVLSSAFEKLQINYLKSVSQRRELQEKDLSLNRHLERPPNQIVVDDKTLTLNWTYRVEFFLEALCSRNMNLNKLVTLKTLIKVFDYTST